MGSPPPPPSDDVLPLKRCEAHIRGIGTIEKSLAGVGEICTFGVWAGGGRGGKVPMIKKPFALETIDPVFLMYDAGRSTSYVRFSNIGYTKDEVSWCSASRKAG